jgi:hypothetical protein
MRESGYHYPTVIFLGAAKLDETTFLQPLTRHTKKIMMIGDHKRFYPVILDQLREIHPVHSCFCTFERLTADSRYRNSTIMLREQDNIPTAVSKRLSDLFYQSKLVSVADTKGCHPNGISHLQLYFQNVERPNETHHIPRTDRTQANEVGKIVNWLISQKVQPRDITVLGVTKAQTALLQECVRDDVLCIKIERFGAKWNKYIVASLHGFERKMLRISPSKIATLLSAPREALYLVGSNNDLRDTLFASIIDSCAGQPGYDGSSRLTYII